MRHTPLGLASPQELLESAFSRLAEQPGFVERLDQRQLAMLISDCLEGESSGLFEAPTGLGKSLAALIPALSHAIAAGKRTVIATYTNVLAEQYWRKDLPFALSLFPGHEPKTCFLIGRQRYACLAEMHASAPWTVGAFGPYAELGIESEFRATVRKPLRELAQAWQKIAAPPICPARLCPHYGDCYYYRARRQAERAGLVITNHSVVLQDALLRRASEGELTLLGDYDLLVLDEAHDFPQAAQNAFEFEISGPTLARITGLSGRIESALLPLAPSPPAAKDLVALQERLKARLAQLGAGVEQFGRRLGPGILDVRPREVWSHGQVQRSVLKQGLEPARELATEIADEVTAFVKGVQEMLPRWRSTDGSEPAKMVEATETFQSYAMFLREFAIGARTLFAPRDPDEEDSLVAYLGETMDRGPILRSDPIDLAPILQELIWSRGPWVGMSATLALDGNFEFFGRITGATPDFAEILPTPFDYASQSALYIPKAGTIPDPSLARSENNEGGYYGALAREISKIIRAMGGRTLALFHSRREMEGVYERLDLPEELGVLMQKKGGVASVGDAFRREEMSSLFGLRSFWTGFDAPGDTLSCVILVRVPFEVPVDPLQVARMAYLQGRGFDPFQSYSLPNAKMLLRQGAGRLIRRADDRGVIALLDPRVRTKRYGEDLLANLPPEMRTYDDFLEAMAAVGLDAYSATQ